MHCGVVMPSGNARDAVEFARTAEEAGWDGVFLWESVWSSDAWVGLTAAAMVTTRIRLGTMLTPIARMRPWDLAAKSATLDDLSNGRMTIAIGLGAPETGYEAFGEVTDIRTRAELTDEGLDILTGLWNGQPFNYEGKHYTIRETDFTPPPPPVQQPRIPLWVVAIDRPRSMARAARYDGAIHQGDPDTLPALRATIDGLRDQSRPFEYVVEGSTPGDDRAAARATADRWEQAGATWYNEVDWELPRDAEGRASALARVRQGPPRA